MKTARDLARLEGMMCGISSGTNVAAAKRKDSGYIDSGYRREIFFNGIIQGWGKLRFPHP